MVVVKSGSGFKIKSHSTGRTYPKIYKSKSAAEKRIKQMNYFKHQGR